MKRLITLSLAALMVMGLCTTAFASAVPASVAKLYDAATLATTGDSPFRVGSMSTTMYVSLHDVDANEDDILTVNPVYDAKGFAAVQPGWTVYYPLMTPSGTVTLSSGDEHDPNATVGTQGTGHSSGTPDHAGCTDVYTSKNVTLADAVKSLKVSSKYKMGNDAIDSIKILYKKEAVSKDYGYYLAIKTKDMSGTGYKDVAAELTLKKSSGTDDAKKSLTAEIAYNIAFRIRLDDLKTRGLNIYKNAFQINASSNDPDSEETVEFPETNGVYFEVSMFSQARTVVSMSLDFDKDIINIYPTANLDFFNGNGATFNRIGTLTIPAKSDTFIYMRDDDGRLVNVEAEYDDGEEAFKVPTRVLGQYVVSDVELDLTLIPVATPEGEPTPEEPVLEPEAPVKENVPTGAVA